MSQEPNDKDRTSFSLLRDALNSLKRSRPNDRTEKDRSYAVCITEIEKALAYFDVFVLGVTSETPQIPQ